jgi:hypothetical protein
MPLKAKKFLRTGSIGRHGRQTQCSFLPGDYNSGILEHLDDKKPQDLSELVLVTSRMKMKESIEIQRLVREADVITFYAL